MYKCELYIKRQTYEFTLYSLHMIEGNVHQDRMKRRLQALSFNKQRHCFQFTFLATDRKTHEGHVSRDAGRTDGRSC